MIFIHIPRTAGTSIVEFAKDQGLLEPNVKIWDGTQQFVTLRHRDPAWYMTKGYVSQEWWNKAIKFTVVRNPWDRLVSLYEYLRSFRLNRRPRYTNKYLENFEAFAAEIASGSKWVHSLGRSNVRHFSQANPQVKWLRLGVDRILRHETLADYWGEFCVEVGLPRVPLPHTNTTIRDHYRSYYTDELAEKVGEFYKEDVERFDYEF